MIANQHVVAEIKAALPCVFDVAKYGDLEKAKANSSIFTREPNPWWI